MFELKKYHRVVTELVSNDCGTFIKRQVSLQRVMDKMTKAPALVAFTF